MLQVGVIGINHKLAGLKLRENLAKICQRKFNAFHAIQEDHSFVLVSTCNRTEIYFCSEDLTITHMYILKILRMEVIEEFDHKLYSYFGRDCFAHLTRVTAGLDSAIIGETEIQGQIKTAYDAVIDYHTLPQSLHFLFQQALRIAKQVRAAIQLGRGMPNLEHAILQIGKQIFNFPKNARLLFVGTSKINLNILNFFQSKNFNQMTICNRSNQQALAIATINNISYLEWSYLPEWHKYDWIIFGTKSPDYLVHYQELSQEPTSHKLIMDLCVPRNVDPALEKSAFVTLLNIDQINCSLKTRRHSMTHKILEAEQKVTQAITECMQRYTEKIQNKTKLFAITV